MGKHKHQWRKVGGTWNKDGCHVQRKRCLSCGEEKEVKADG